MTVRLSILSIGGCTSFQGDDQPIPEQIQVVIDNVRFCSTVECSVAVPAGDYNDNGIVDAADYTLWRDHLGQTFTLMNENPAAATPGVVDAEDYAFWKSHFGQSLGSGSGVICDCDRPRAGDFGAADVCGN